MFLAFRQWIDQASGLFRSNASLFSDSEFCIAYAGHGPARMPTGIERQLHWGHVPLSRLTILHGIH